MTIVDDEARREIIEDRLIRLHAEMRLPGEA
jgi:hypothetical protein